MARLMVISSKRIYANRLHLSGLLRPVPLTPQQATVNPCLCQGLSNIHRQVCLGLLWGHSSFHMSPGAHKILFVQFSCSVMFDSLQPHGLQHATLPCPSPPPGGYSNSCPLSQWCYPTVSFFVVPFSHLQHFSVRVFSNESVLHIRWP